MTSPLPDRVPLEAITQARERIRDSAIRTPLIRLPHDGPGEIWLKLETLQPVGSFKIRGARNAVAGMSREELRRGIYTASAGNMALGLAWCANRLGIPFTAIVPDHAPRAKLSGLERLSARIVPVPFARWWQVLRERQFDGIEGRFIHPVSDLDVMAGNATIGVEIAEDLPGVETVLVPFGGGGLSAGIASALGYSSPAARVMACEVESAAPLSAALRAGAPQQIDYQPSFVDGIGAGATLPEMWPIVKQLIAGVIVSSLEETAEAVRTLVARVHVVAEGAGAVPVAAALSGKAGTGTICCVISGGNIDPARLAAILTRAPGCTGPAPKSS